MSWDWFYIGNRLKGTQPNQVLRQHPTKFCYCCTLFSSSWSGCFRCWRLPLFALLFLLFSRVFSSFRLMPETSASRASCDVARCFHGRHVSWIIRTHFFFLTLLHDQARLCVGRTWLYCFFSSILKRCFVLYFLLATHNLLLSRSSVFFPSRTRGKCRC